MYGDMEESKMKKLFIVIVVLIFGCTVGFIKFAEATKMWGRIAQTGGNNSVDNIPYASIADGDLVIVINSSSELYFYRFDDDNGGTEDGTYIIKPDDAGAGAGRWVLISGQHFNGAASPGFTAYDSGNPGTDLEIGKMYWNYIDGADGSENGDSFWQTFQDGAQVTFVQLDESDDQIESKKAHYFEKEIFTSNEAVTCASNVCTISSTVITHFITTENNAAADVATVADGAKAGEVQIFVLKSDGGDDLEITPTNFAEGTKITIGTTGNGCAIIFDGTNWHVFGNNGGVVS